MDYKKCFLTSQMVGLMCYLSYMASYMLAVWVNNEKQLNLQKVKEQEILYSKLLLEANNFSLFQTLFVVYLCPVHIPASLESC